MVALPNWLEESLQCPVTGEKLTRETAGGRPVYVARPDGGEPVQYDIDNGVPVLVPN